ncbi:hypothetical protein [Ralstonia solanacearum]|uniref:hypothetical protein n=1 Tax=Ralstonia solanacearum TaxID=305 RepID=UPI0012D3C5CF|nr:hypothetical protein [Ralstonia solanacearum]
MTDNHQAQQCRKARRPSPASPRNKLAAGEKTLLRRSAASQSSESAPASGQDNAEQAQGAGIAERLHFTRDHQPLRPAQGVKIGGKLASDYAGGDWIAEPPGKADEGAHPACVGRRIQAIDLPAMAHDGHNRARV